MISIIGLSQKLVQSSLPIKSAIKNIGFISNMNSSNLMSKQKESMGISTSQSKLYYCLQNKISKIIFEVPNASELLTTGLNTVSKSNKKVEWIFDPTKESYHKLYIATASDSAKNFIVYSGYIYFPTLNKWKLIASFRINGSTEMINTAGIFKSKKVQSNINELFNDIWTQGDNGSWNNIYNTGTQKPVLPPFSDLDSANRAINDSLIIQEAIKSKQTDAANFKNGLYYTFMKTAPNSDLVKVTDTVSIFYKGYIMGTDIVFDQTSKETRTFPLNRLIKGWQVGLDSTHVGDKIKLLIPSGLAYSIRTRAPLIPPNSLLVFEIETLSVKSANNGN